MYRSLKVARSKNYVLVTASGIRICFTRMLRM